MSNAFQNYKTEKKAFKYFNKLYYVEPKSVHVGTILISKRKFRKKIYTKHKVHVKVIDIKKVLQYFLELPNVFNIIIEHKEKMENCDYICSIIQSERWKFIRQKYGNKIVIPFILYGDDFEINNAIGSRKCKNKIHAFYFNISSLPPKYASMLQNIFLIQVFKTAYNKKLRDSKLLHPIIQQIKDLQENGIEIYVGKKSCKDYFELFNYKGDNLDIHDSLGFSTSFNGTYPCRIILVESVLWKKKFVRSLLL